MLLAELLARDDYKMLVEDALKSRPAIPVFDIQRDNVEQWKRHCAMRDGFDLCFQFFGGDIDGR